MEMYDDFKASGNLYADPCYEMDTNLSPGKIDDQKSETNSNSYIKMI